MPSATLWFANFAGQKVSNVPTATPPKSSKTGVIRRKPTVGRHHLQAADGRSIARGVRQLRRNGIPRQTRCRYLFRGQIFECRLTQEKRNALKRHPIICEALEIVNRVPRFAQGIYPEHARAGYLKDITLALCGVGDREAAKAALRLTHKAFVDMPFMLQPDLFLTVFHARSAAVVRPEIATAR